MLVKIMGIEKQEFLTVSSREVAEDFEKEHKSVIYAIEGRKCTCGGNGCEKCQGRGYQQLGLLNETGDKSHVSKMFIESVYTDIAGRKQKEYLLTRDGFSLLVMGFTGAKALEWKLKYIRAFNEMEKELKRLYEERQKWEIERAKGVVIRHVLTDTIKMKVPDSPNKRFAYPNYTKMIYKFIFGKGMKELREQYGVKGKESIRDCITADELREVESLEMLVSSLINLGMGYDEIKNFIESKTAALLAG